MRKVSMTNKLAWEQAYDKSPSSYKDIELTLKENPEKFLNPLVIEALKPYDLKGKSAAQLACNNGREILGLQRVYGLDNVVGFDIAKNMIESAHTTAKKLNLHAQFVETDILDISHDYDQKFDFVFVMIGALCWFEHTSELIGIASRLLKKEGHLIIVDGHPTSLMFAFEDEPNYDPNNPYALQNDYFKKTPFIDNSGMYYMTHSEYESNPFISFSYTFEDIILACIKHDLVIRNFKESNLNLLENFNELDQKHIPLTFMLDALKNK